MMPDAAIRMASPCRAIVFYYSWTGNTARVAQAIAASLQCEAEAIVERRPRHGRGAAFRSMLDTLLRRKPAILPLHQQNLSDYDIVVVGGPVWARGVAGPLRTFLRQFPDGVRRAAVFCTEAGAGGDTVLDIMTQALKTPVVARCVISQADLASGAWTDKVRSFSASIRADLAGLRILDKTIRSAS